MRAIAFIFARGGSKGLEGKNVRELGGKPLIAYAIETARACSLVETVIVSTDDTEIMDVAKQFGAEAPFVRPTELATDDAPEWLAWQHAVDWFRAERGDFDVFVSLPPTSPFRSIEDVAACIQELKTNPEADMVITGSSAARSPYFNMVQRDSQGYVDLVIPNMPFTRRQDAPELFDLSTVAYVARPGFIQSANRMFDGKIRMVEIPCERALDIDTTFDFEMAEFLANRKN